MKPDFLPIEILCGVGLVLIVALVILMLRRRTRAPKWRDGDPWDPAEADRITAEQHQHSLGIHGTCKCFLCEGGRRRANATTPTCPMCGKYDPEHPFIRHAISCYRKDCAT